MLAPQRFASLDRVLAKLESSGARVILLLPPLAPPFVQAIAESGRYRFLPALDRELAARGREYYNFHDPAAIDSKHVVH